MIRFVLAVLCCGGVALQLVWTTFADRGDESRDHVEAPTHVRLVRWAIDDDSDGAA